MERPRFTVNQTLVSAFAVVGVVVVSAIAFNYAGSISLRFGADGIQLQVDGGGKAP